jgi:hypothetical protein
VILGIEKLDWNNCKKTLKDPQLMEKLAQVTKERATEVLEELTLMMIEKRKNMDPKYMATMHH